MKKLLSCLVVILFFTQIADAQMKNTRRKALGISIFKNDFVTPQRIRSTSLSSVFAGNRWAKLSEMNTGVAISYLKGVLPKIDVMGSINFSSVNLPLPGKSFSDKNLLLEADASGHFKLLDEGYLINPYAVMGVGASKYKSIYGAFIPLGLGVKVKIKDETQAFLQFQYRIPVTTEANNYHFQASLGLTGWFGQMMK